MTANTAIDKSKSNAHETMAQPTALTQLQGAPISLEDLPPANDDHIMNAMVEEELHALEAKDAKEKEPILGVIAPESWLGKELGAIGNEMQGYRKATITALPSFIINNNSNFLGATELLAEGFMFQAGGVRLFPEKMTTQGGKTLPNIFGGNFQRSLEHKSPALSYKHGSGITAKLLKGLNPIIEPVFNVYKAVSEGASFNFKAKDLTNPKFYKETFSSFFNLEKATKIDQAKTPGKKLLNRWQTRSTTLGLIGMTVATFMPDDVDRPEDVQKNAEMAATNPIGYVGTKIATALNPLQWWEHKRSFAGFMKTGGGLATLLSGFRNVDKNNHYFVNKAHAINGFITAAAGSQLLLGVDGQQAWGRYGSLMGMRMIFLPSSIKKRYEKGDRDRHYYAAGQATFQLGNLNSFLIGGAEKLPDGTIVDLKSQREAAKEKALALKQQQKEEKLIKKEGNTLENQPSPGEAAIDTTKLSQQPPISTINTAQAELISPDRTQQVA